MKRQIQLIDMTQTSGNQVHSMATNKQFLYLNFDWQQKLWIMASFLFDRLNQIDDRTKFGVYGWIRKAEQQLKLGNIPLRIHSVVILYFAEEEEFDIAGDGIKISDDGKTATKENYYSWSNLTYAVWQNGN